MRLSCPRGGPKCSIDVRARAQHKKKRMTIGTAKLTIKPGKSVTVKLSLTRAGAKLLRSAQRLRVAVTLITKAGATRRTHTKTITIGTPKRPPSKRRT